MSSSAAMVAKLIKQPVSYFYVTTGDLFQKYYGESEKAPQALYQVAREEQPSIVVIDEVCLTQFTHEVVQNLKHFKNRLMVLCEKGVLTTLTNQGVPRQHY